MADVPDDVQSDSETSDLGVNDADILHAEETVLAQEALAATAALNHPNVDQFTLVVEEEEDDDTDDSNMDPEGTDPLDIADGIAIPRDGETYNLPDLFGNSPLNIQHTHRRGTPQSHQRRIFKEVNVGNFVVQPKDVRYPAKEGVLPPRPASWRSNLAALSQEHNLYFAAIMDQLYVTVPRGLKHTIPGTPDLILDLPVTAVGKTIPSHFASAKPHAVNHLKVGNLGRLEVVVMACDDGDVLVYYSHLLQRQIDDLAKGKKDITAIEPFLHENVGKSAWGIGIHDKSRLIAVGSNLREITLFCPAYNLWPPPKDVQKGTRQPHTLRVSLSSPYLEVSPPHPRMKERRLCYRARYQLGIDGHNIPAVDFASDDEGDAQSILAADINGNLWIIDIWSGIRKKVQSYDPAAVNRPSTPVLEDDEDGPNQMGWGVMFLPLSYFKHERTPHEALGSKYISDIMSTRDELGVIAGKGASFDLTISLPQVNESNRYYPTHHAAKLRANEIKKLQTASPSLALEDLEKTRYEESQSKKKYLHFITMLLLSDTELRSCVLGAVPGFFRPTQQLDLKTRNRIVDILKNDHDNPLVRRWVEDKLSKVDRFNFNMRRDMKMFEEAMATQTQSCIFDQADCPEIPEAYVQHATKLSKDTLLTSRTACILRTFNHDLQILPSARNQLPSTVCRGLLQQEVPATPIRLRHFDRLNMLAVIPELNLAIVGSQLGRAALVTLTYVDYAFEKPSEYAIKQIPTMRIDLILPLSRDETPNRPIAPLLGIAVGKVPGKCNVWRILLHFMEHSILSYDVSRSSEEELIVF